MHSSETDSPEQNTSTHQSLATRIPRIAIVGAGFVGSTTAYALMMSGMAAEIALIDRDARRAEGHVNDLRDAEVFPILLAFSSAIFRTVVATVKFPYYRQLAWRGLLSMSFANS